MINPAFALGAMLLYLLLLFGVAHYAERKRDIGRSIVSNPYVYALSFSVYVTAWTFYGSVGRSATDGLGFLPIYLGPTLVMLLSWTVLRKMITISKEHRLATISDFISFRYGRSYVIGALVAVAILVVITPYIALQLIAISESLTIISGPFHEGLGARRLLVAVLLGAFAIIFGARYLDPLERHEGLIAVVAFESVVKLVAFLAAGLYITYGLFGGYGEIVGAIASNPDHSHLLEVNYVSWFTLIMMSSLAILFLPRQFHVMVVENSREEHLKKAMWLFPLYLLLINLFVPAVAWGGILLGAPGRADMWMVSIPMSQGQEMLALLVFIGGTSAATAMVLVSAVTVGTMILNDLEMPYIVRKIGKGRNLPTLILNLKRLNILLVIALGYLYSLLVGFPALVDIGLLSFLAVCQLAPAALGGLYWKKGCRQGAIAGLVAGFLIWAYTALLPTLADAGWVSEGLMATGPFGIALLRPTALFGLELDLWTHAFFWSILVNFTLYVFFSLIHEPSEEEKAIAEGFVDVYRTVPRAEPAPVIPLGDGMVIRVGTVDELEGTVARYIGADRAKSVVEMNLADLKTTREGIDARDLFELRDRLEKTLTGSLGPSATRMIVEEEVAVKPAVEVMKETRAIYTLDPGKAYIIPEKAYEVFTDQIMHGIEGLCITTSDPDEIRTRWHFTETPIIRLSGEKGRGERYIPKNNLPLLFVTIKSFVESSKNSIILLDCMEELIEENASSVPESEVLDFVHALDSLSEKGRTRVVLLARPEFVNRRVAAEINEAEELIFLLGPISAYLFKVFADSIMRRLDPSSRAMVMRDLEDMMGTEKAFTGMRRPHEGDGCDPEMGEIGPEFGRSGLKIDPAARLSRWEFFGALRLLAKAVQRSDPTFDLASAAKPLIAKYGLNPIELRLVPGTTYVIEEDKPAKSLGVYSDLVRRGVEGLCISRYHPEKLMERYGLSPEGVIWLTQASGAKPHYRQVDPTNFPRLSSMISDFLSRSEEPLVLLEGLGYLITQSNYESVLRFVQSQRDEVSLKKGILIIHIDPLALDTKELHRLKSEMEILPIGDEKR
ncbi:MAG: Na+/solute symporter [Methanothrix sp.]|nr:MAG: Na+/solute symporter [Methanothrix sp.]